jgi:hypothetical protein
MNIVVSSSAWAGPIGGGAVDEVEAVRNRQRGASRVCHYPEKIATNPVGNDWHKTLSVIEVTTKKKVPDIL